MKIGVLGSGIMGHGIAQVSAQAGNEVTLVDQSEESLKKAQEAITRSLEKLAKKDDTIQVNEILSHITYTTDKRQFQDATIVIEAITENMELKKQTFKELDSLCDEKTILASNTSSLSISEMAEVTERKDRVCGLHFFNPVPLMNLVEMTCTEWTSTETREVAERFVAEIHKESIQVRDTPMFVVNRLLVPMVCEAISLVDEGTATVEAIDKAMKLGAHHPIGPLWLADMIGLDTLLRIQEALYIKTEDSKYRVPELLRKMVAAGELGRKSGKGFYQY